MNYDQESVMRDVRRGIKTMRTELDEMYLKKQKLEKLSDRLFAAYLDDLWDRTNIQLNELYNNILEKFNNLAKLQNILLRIKLGEIFPKDDLNQVISKR